MNGVAWPVQSWLRAVARGWDRFWFQPALPHTLAAIRILGGAMLLYTHTAWTIGLEDFLGAKSWLGADTAALLNRGAAGYNFAWSFWYWIESPALVWTVHLAALVVFALLTVGLFTRVVAVLAFIAAVSYCHRLNGTLFGLDQINVFVAMYLMLGDSGGVWSVDRWLARRRRTEPCSVLPAVGTNIAVRLLQVHMCVIYLFGGIGKARGPTWWDGTAMWLAFANLEYQSLDMTWTVHYPWLLALLAHVTVFWETFYCFLVWPKLTRPIVLGLAVLVHLGIAVCLGMKTFGLAMIIGNIAFVYPETVRGFVGWFGRGFQSRESLSTRADSSPQSPILAAGR
jgi:hypothetical protein